MGLLRGGAARRCAALRGARRVWRGEAVVSGHITTPPPSIHQLNAWRRWRLSMGRGITHTSCFRVNSPYYTQLKENVLNYSTALGVDFHPGAAWRGVAWRGAVF